MDASNLAPSAKSSPINKRGLPYFSNRRCTTAVIARIFTLRSKKLMRFSVNGVCGCVMADSYSRNYYSVVYSNPCGSAQLMNTNESLKSLLIRLFSYSSEDLH